MTGCQKSVAPSTAKPIDEGNEAKETSSTEDGVAIAPRRPSHSCDVEVLALRKEAEELRVKVEADHEELEHMAMVLRQREAEQMQLHEVIDEQHRRIILMTERLHSAENSQRKADRRARAREHTLRETQRELAALRATLVARNQELEEAAHKVDSIIHTYPPYTDVQGDAKDSQPPSKLIEDGMKSLRVNSAGRAAGADCGTDERRQWGGQETGAAVNAGPVKLHLGVHQPQQQQDKAAASMLGSGLTMSAATGSPPGAGDPRNDSGGSRFEWARSRLAASDGVAGRLARSSSSGGGSFLVEEKLVEGKAGAETARAEDVPTPQPLRSHSPPPQRVYSPSLMSDRASTSCSNSSSSLKELCSNAAHFVGAGSPPALPQERCVLDMRLTPPASGGGGALQQAMVQLAWAPTAADGEPAGGAEPTIPLPLCESPDKPGCGRSSGSSPGPFEVVADAPWPGQKAAPAVPRLAGVGLTTAASEEEVPLMGSVSNSIMKDGGGAGPDEEDRQETPRLFPCDELYSQPEPPQLPQPVFLPQGVATPSPLELPAATGSELDAGLEGGAYAAAGGAEPLPWSPGSAPAMPTPIAQPKAAEADAAAGAAAGAAAAGSDGSLSLGSSPSSSGGGGSGGAARSKRLAVLRQLRLNRPRLGTPGRMAGEPGLPAVPQAGTAGACGASFR